MESNFNLGCEVRGGQMRSEEVRGGQRRSCEARAQASQRRPEEARGGLKRSCEARAQASQRRQTYRQYMVKPMLLFIYYLFIVAIALHFRKVQKP